MLDRGGVRGLAREMRLSKVGVPQNDRVSGSKTTDDEGRDGGCPALVRTGGGGLFAGCRSGRGAGGGRGGGCEARREGGGGCFGEVDLIGSIDR